MGDSRHYTEDERKLVRELYPRQPASEIAVLLGRSPTSVYSKAQELGLQKNGRYCRRPWTKEELELVRELYPHRPTKEIAETLGRPVMTIYGQATKLGVHKTEEFLSSPLAGILYKGDPRQIGAHSRFAKGHTPANKGLRRPGWAAGRSRETQFKKGQRSRNWKPVGTILPDTDGYLRIKVRDGPGGFGNARAWAFLHREVWEQFKGPIPPKRIVTFKDRNKANCSIDNLECISKAENARRNNMWTRYPREIAEAIQLTGALKRKIRRIEKERNG